MERFASGAPLELNAAARRTCELTQFRCEPDETPRISVPKAERCRFNRHEVLGDRTIGCAIVEKLADGADVLGANVRGSRFDRRVPQFPTDRDVLAIEKCGDAAGYLVIAQLGRLAERTSVFTERRLFDMRHRINLVGIIWIILGVFLVLGGVAIALTALALILSGQVFLMANSESGGWFIARCMGVIAICSFAMGVISIVAGRALRKRRPWARTAIVILSVINLINFPIGTGIGLYSLFVLFSGDVKVAFATP